MARRLLQSHSLSTASCEPDSWAWGPELTAFSSHFEPLPSAKREGGGEGEADLVLPWHCLLLVLGAHIPPGLQVMLLSLVGFVSSITCFCNVLFLQLEEKK